MCTTLTHDLSEFGKNKDIHVALSLLVGESLICKHMPCKLQYVLLRESDRCSMDFLKMEHNSEVAHKAVVGIEPNF